MILLALSLNIGLSALFYHTSGERQRREDKHVAAWEKTGRVDTHKPVIERRKRDNLIAFRFYIGAQLILLAWFAANFSGRAWILSPLITLVALPVWAIVFGFRQAEFDRNDPMGVHSQAIVKRMNQPAPEPHPSIVKGSAEEVTAASVKGAVDANANRGIGA